MNATEQYLTPEQIKHGFSLEIQSGIAVLMLKGKKIAFFKEDDANKETIQNVANTLWEAYTLGLQDAIRIAHSDKLFDEVGKNII